ncbi:AraC family transcriptional regulator [Psychromonas aquimarina]|uniref:AraC family transcriptional regulator n=1 Tax=Psychromonas aquimarina TaxID=444919 RepID=UPI0004285120|nr:AraC family transcriptional regulator [Psychromonas aquimarina]
MKTVSNIVSMSFYNHLKMMGVNPLPLFQSAGIHYEELSSTEGRIDEFRHYKLLELIDPYMGTLNDMPVIEFNLLLQHFMPLASACLNAPSLRQALSLYFQYRGIVGECDRFFQSESEGKISFIYQSEHGGDFTSHCGAANFLLLNSLIKHHHPHLDIQKNISIASRSLCDIKTLSDAAECPVRKSESNIFTISSEVLDIENENANSVLQPFLLDNLNRTVNSSLRNKKFSSQIMKIIKDSLRRKTDSVKSSNILDTACQKLCITRWTLNRRLQAENTSFSTLLTQFRREQACRLLRKNELTMSDISELLGFNNHSSFSRFFNEQFKQTPLNFRKANVIH